MKEFFQNSLDKKIVLEFLEDRSSFGVGVFKLITFFGGWEFILVALCLVVTFLIYKKRAWLVVPLIFSSALAGLITFLGKVEFRRARPLLSAITENSFSFPSGHATIVVAFYGFVAYIILRLYPKFNKRIIIASTLIITLLIGLSRMYLGVHYLSDVLVGYVVGGLSLVLFVKLSDKYLIKKYE